jgi:hypothetical protein
MHRPETGWWLERELEWGLREVSAPAELWDRVRTASVVRAEPDRPFRWGLVWATAAAAILIAMAAAVEHRRPAESDEALALRALNGDAHFTGFRCKNPSQLRAWARAKTGLDLPLRADTSASIELIGAQALDGARGVEVAYRAGNHAAALIVSRAASAASRPGHDHASGNVSTWVMEGQRYTLACNDPAGLQLACKLCHLD